MAGPVSPDSRRIEILASVEARYADFDMMAASAIGWDQQYDHIGRGRFEGSLSMVVLNTLQIGRERWKPGIMQRAGALVVRRPSDRRGRVASCARPANRQRSTGPGRAL